MALSLGVTEGSKIQVGDGLLEVLNILRGTSIDVIYKGVRHLITDAERVEVAPEVFLSCGGRLDTPAKRTRLAFEAPRAIQITRVA